MSVARLHCAVLNDQAQFDPASFSVRDGTAPGITILMGRRKGSRTEEGVAYRFEATQFSADQARAWLEQRHIESRGFQEAEPEPEEGLSFTVAVLQAGDFPGSVDGKPAQVPLTRDEIEQIRVDTNRLLQDRSLDVVARVRRDQAVGGAQLGHAADQSAVDRLFPDGGAAALGHMSQLRWIGDTLAADFKGVSQKFADYVRRGLWNARSADLIHNWTHPVDGRRFQTIMKSLSWLGSEMPAVPVHEIWGLAATSGGTAPAGTGTAPTGGQEIRIFFTDGSHVPGSPAGGATADPTKPTPGQSGTDENHAAQAAEESPDMGEIDDLRRQMQELSAQVAGLNTRATQAEEKVELAKKQRVTDTLDRARDERRITPAQHEQYSKVALAMSFENAAAYVDTVKDRPQAPDPTKPLAATGAAAGTDLANLTGEAKIIAFAQQFVAEGKGTIAQGTKAAIAAFPADAEAHLVARGYNGRGE